jgi:hypothetical protein
MVARHVPEPRKSSGISSSRPVSEAAAPTSQTAFGGLAGHDDVVADHAGEGFAFAPWHFLAAMKRADPGISDRTRGCRE